ncbi:MAG: hypothetical protein HN742_09310, partial [Lentisphaerae bacterium]|nr:hypothetical protein [Lentisphaerota bacterium]
MVTSGSIPLSDSVDWGTYLARHDLVWDRLPHRWENGVFLGNGLLGTLMHVDLQLNRVRWWICRSDVGRIREREELIGVVNRRVIGSMDLVAVGEFGDPGGDARLGLWDAGAAGSVKTQRGNIGWCCFVPEKPNVVILELDWTSRWPESGYHVDPTFQEPGERSCSGDIRLYTVPDVDDVHGGGYTVVWRDTDLGDGKRLVVFSVGSSPSCRKMWKADDDGRSATDEALEALQAVDAGGLAAIRQSHQARWHDHYRRSFVSFANTELESHYWIQLYKHRSAARPEGPMIDNHGPWTTESRYGFSTWDMNVQAINRLHLPSNHAELGQPLMRFMDVNFTHERMLHGPSGELRAGVTHSAFLYLEDLQKETKETPAGTASCDSACKFLWACHNLWLQYRFTMDQALLVPLGDRLEGGINTFVAYCVPGDDGKLHVDDGYSWEACRGVPDPTCYIAVVEWAIQCRMKIDRLLGRDLDARWPELLDRLPPYPQGPEGYYLAVDHPPMPHRHWSHLMQIWPFHTVNWEQPQNREMIQKSVDHWVDLSAGPKAELPCAGFAVAAAIQLYAHMGQAEPIPELAEIYLHEWSKRGAMCWASTLYREMGPVIESPLLFADALLATMLQSWNGVIRVFPAWPDAWGDVVFHGLRAEGGFSVSAAREDGRVAWVAITSEVSTVSCSGKRSSSTVPSSGERSSSTVPSSGERSSSTVPSSGERSSSTVPSSGERSSSTVPSSGER